MTDFEDEVQTVLREAEDRLIKLMAEAGDARDYDGVELIRTVARELDEIASTVSKGGRFLQSSHLESGYREKTGDPSQRVKRGRYPRFVVQGGALEKIGWSSKENSEYSHRIPREEFEAVVKELEARGMGSDRPIQSSEVLKSLENRVKHYQVYAVLRFLRATDAIAPAARGAYMIPKNLRGRAFKAWKSVSND